jgi:hypothetical protein
MENARSCRYRTPDPPKDPPDAGRRGGARGHCLSWSEWTAPVRVDRTSRDLARMGALGRTAAVGKSADGRGGVLAVGEEALCQAGWRPGGGPRGRCRGRGEPLPGGGIGRGWNREVLGFPGPVASFMPSISWTAGWIHKTTGAFCKNVK